MFTALLERHLSRLPAFLRLRFDERMRQRESTSDLVPSVCREVLENESGFVYEGEARYRMALSLLAYTGEIERLGKHVHPKLANSRAFGQRVPFLHHQVLKASIP